MRISAVVLAGGESTRMGRDKLLMELFGETVLNRTLSAFRAVEEIDEIVLVGKSSPLADIEVEGGSDRRESSVKGVEAATGDVVLIHDGARPFVSSALIKRVVACTLRNRSAVPCIKLKDSIKRVIDGRIVSSPPREEHRAVQTPQGFFRADILKALRASTSSVTDDSQPYAEFFSDPYVVEGEETNIKLTTPADVASTSRYAIGYDLHRLVEGRKFVLGGVEIPSDRGMLAHSDGDVLLHALTDAILALGGLKDIGCYFPDTDPEYKDASSVSIIKRAYALARERGVVLKDVSAVVVADSPKLNPYRSEIVSSIAEVLELRERDVSLSFKTTERTSPDSIEVFAIASKK